MTECREMLPSITILLIAVIVALNTARFAKLESRIKTLEDDLENIASK